MKRHFVRVAAGTTLALTALVGSLPQRAIAATPPAGTLLIVAGTGERGFSGDGGPATQARLGSPWDVAFDAAGNLFIAEEDSRRVRKVTPEGIITTVVGGGGKRPVPLDGIPATEARIDDVDYLAFDGAGNLFLAGLDKGLVWKVTPDGMITVIAGTDKRGFSGDGGPALQARLSPGGLATDSAGNLFITDDNRVRKMTPDGVITTIAGIGKGGFAGDGGPATQARVSPAGLAVDGAGNLFIGEYDYYRVRKVTPDGVITTVAGSSSFTPPGQGQLSGVGGPATSAGLRGPLGLAVDAAGNLFIADTAWWDLYFAHGHQPANEHVLEVVGVAAPGLIAGKPFPKP